MISSPLAIVPTFIDLVLALLGLLTLNQFIRFGSKLMVIGVDELSAHGISSATP